jgi:hypothetical protein
MLVKVKVTVEKELLVMVTLYEAPESAVPFVNTPLIPFAGLLQLVITKGLDSELFPLDKHSDQLPFSYDFTHCDEMS